VSSATITSKGKATISKEIRDALDLQPKDKVEFTLLPDGTFWKLSGCYAVMESVIKQRFSIQ